MKYFLIFAAALLLVGTSNAQTSTSDDVSPVIQARATALTKSMINKVQLNEGQYLRIKQLNERMLTEMDDNKSRYASDQATLDQRTADLQTRYEQSLQALLRPYQVALYQQSRTSMMALGDTGL